MPNQNGSLYFQESEIIKKFEDDLIEIFSTDEAMELFGTSFEIRSEYDDISNDLSFPCILISFDDFGTAETYSTSEQVQQFTSFVLLFEIYAKGIDDKTPTATIRLISEYLTRKFQEKYNLLIMSSNRPLPNIDDTIARRQITFTGTLNNQNHMIYST